MKELHRPKNIERKPIPPEKKAADLFILGSKMHPASVTLQGAEIARICRQNNYSPEGLQFALMRDPKQITRIMEVADREHGKHNQKEQALVDSRQKKVTESKYLPPVERGTSIEIIHTAYFWASEIYKLPLEEIEAIIATPIHASSVAIKEHQRREVIREKLQAFYAKNQS